MTLSNIVCWIYDFYPNQLSHLLVSFLLWLLFVSSDRNSYSDHWSIGPLVHWSRSEEHTNAQVKQAIDTKASAITDGANNYNDLANNLTTHEGVVLKDKKETNKILPWVHIAISNAKRLLLDVHHSIGEQYLQSYLDEFCYKFNRKYFNSVFDRVVSNSVSMKWEVNV